MQFNLHSSRWLLALGLTVGAVTAHATHGFSTAADRESAVQVGMSTSQVREALGDPSRVVQARRDPGPTWTYDVVTAANRALFEVDFDANGKVSGVSKRELQTQ